MKRWIWKRAAVALVAAAGMTATAGAQTANKPADPDIIVLKFDGQKDRKVKVVKTTRQPDGKTATEVKDIVTGETFTLLDSGPPTGAADKGASPTPPAPPSKDTGLPKARPRTGDILTPDTVRPPLTTTAKPPAPPAATLPVPDPVPEPARRPGPLARLFGRKPSPPPVAAPAAAPALPPLSARAPSIPTTAAAGEPPRAMPKLVAPPQPVIPMPLPIPSAPPNAGGPQSRAGGGPVVLPVGYVPADVALAQDVKPHVHALQHALAPSARVTAVKSLAGGRHASTDQVKTVLMQTAKADPCPMVQACCIEELSKLGYYTSEFVALVRSGRNSPDEDVKAAADAAMLKMTPKK